MQQLWLENCTLPRRIDTESGSRDWSRFLALFKEFGCLLALADYVDAWPQTVDF